MPKIRLVLAAAIVVASVVFAAPVLRSAGFGGWVVAVVASVLLPLAVGAVAGRSVWAFGMTAALAIPASIVVHDLFVRSAPLYAGHADRLALSVCAGTSLLLGAVGTAAADALTRHRRGSGRESVPGPGA